MSGFPDFNGDGHVDGRDYFVWNELNNGSSNRPPSGSNSGCGCSTAFILLLVVGVAVIAGKLFGICPIRPKPGDKVYIPGFGWVPYEGPNHREYAADMYENGNKIGSMG